MLLMGISHTKGEEDSMEKQFETLVVLEEGNKAFTSVLDGACCISAVVALI